MNKQIINVPSGIDFLSQWQGFSLPDHPCILNKQITGCGFTQWVLTNNQNIILCSPRRILLENKEDQYLEELNNGSKLSYKIFYARNEYEKVLDIDNDLTKYSKVDKEVRSEMSKQAILTYKKNIQDFFRSCQPGPFGQEFKYCKILVTYDSYRKVKDALKELGVFDSFHVVIDEFQAIFTDSTFKVNTEMEFVDHLQGDKNITYVSATPMLEEYLDMLDEFKDLPYYELDWIAEDNTRLSRPNIQSFPCSKIMRKAYEIIGKYKNNDWKDSDGNIRSYIDDKGNIHEIESKEVVIFMNSVKNICDLIKYHNLTPDQCNILCARTEENNKKLYKAFGLKYSKREKNPSLIGKVPKKSEMHLNKMFTFCTRTVYLGADFYSTNARSFVFSDANSRCLTVDISLDLPQIVGRQRYEGNPWKNEVNFYYYSTRKDKNQSFEEFKKDIEEKKRKTFSLLSTYNLATEEGKLDLATNFEVVAKVNKYDSDYVSVNRHSKNIPIPVFNNLVMVSEIRSYQVAQVDYSSQFMVRNRLRDQFGIEESDIIRKLIEQFDSESGFINKMKFLCSLEESNEIIASILDSIGDYYSNYYRVLGPERIKSFSYRRDFLEKEYNKIKNNQNIDPKEIIYNTFNIGDKYSKKELKDILSNLYSSMGYEKSPKASDLEEWFELKSIKIKNQDGKWINGFELLGKIQNKKKEV